MELVSLNETKPEFGIDKIRLFTRDFHLKTLDLSKGWEGKPATIRAGEPPEPWFTTGDGQSLTESKWFNNTSDAVVEVTRHGLSVHYNPSTLDHQYHLTKDLQRSWEKVKKQLDGLGIQWEEEESRITRTDLTKQNVMEHPSYVYTNALGLVKGKRMNSRTYGTNAVEVKNSQRALVCYDKTLQLREQKKVTNAPANLLRMEARWTSSKAVGALHTGLHLTNVGELVTASTAHLEDCYNKFLINQVFQTDGQQLALDLVEETETLKYYRANHERGAFKHYLASFGIPALVEKFGANLEALVHVLMEAGYSRPQSYKLVAELRESIRAYNYVQGLRGNTTPLGHLQHLQDTFTTPLHV